MTRLSPEILRSARLDELLSNLSGSEELACMVIDEFLLHCEPQLQEIRAGLDAGDYARTARAAHRFKGSLAAVSAADATKGCVCALESAASRRDAASAETEHALLLPRVGELVRVLRVYREQAAGAP
jgi:HPt (histidine-containing phosphotransfer) domain-containing protein